MALILAALSLLALFSIAWLTIDGLRAIGRRRCAEAASKPRRLLVAKRREVAGELLCLELVDPQGKPLPGFRAGQHLLLTAPAGKHGKAIQRAYSLAAWAARPAHYELGIKREAQGTMTQWLWQNLQVGDGIDVSRAQGDFTIKPGRGPLVLIAGGIGITPLRAMLQAALDSGRPISLFHAARSAEQLLYCDEFIALAGRYAHFSYQPYLSRRADDLSGKRSRLNAGHIVDAITRPTTADFYLCASNSMMADLRHGLRARGIAEARIHHEAFGVGEGAGQNGLTLAVDRAGTTKTLVTAGEPTVLAALEANDVTVSAECRAGSCGQCVAELNSGEVDWLVQPEFAVGPRQFLPCVCTARGDLSLSLK
ncbi:MAG: hypothetical protein H6R16_2812 [Proteobacteria bacterium]|nr:hypothetical protein [Pseudomonadota bacterium]